MALSDFLSNGQVPAGSAATSMTTQTVLPDWYTNYAMDLMAGQKAVSARPYTTAPMPRVADFTAPQQQAFDMTGQAATAYQPGLSAAVQGTQAAANAPSGLSVAQPYFSNAGQTSVANIGQYMNPYTENVVSRIAELGQRNLSENLMPAIEGRYIGAGQLGGPTRGGGLSGAPSGMLTDTARAVRDTSADILGQQAQALQSGYTQAAGLSAADLSRQSALGEQAGTLALQSNTQQLNAAQQMGALGQQAQTLGLTGAGALSQIGKEQQTLNQQNLDTAYQDFLRQQGYPQEQINAMLATMQGVAGAVPKASTEEGIKPLGYQPSYAPSDAQNILGGISTGVGLVKDIAGLIP